MTTVAYCAVSVEGSTDGRQIVMDRSALAGLRALTEAVHHEGAAVAAQIGHAGPVANPTGTRLPAIAPSKVLAPISLKFTVAMTEADMIRVRDDFALAAEIAKEAGFDAIEVHLGHNYLLSSFLSPRLNRRTDRFGGTLAERATFPREVVRAVRSAAGPDIAVTAKLNMADGVRRGLSIEGSLAFAKMLEDDGVLDAITLTAGSSLLNPMYLFRGDAPVKEMAATMPPVMRAAFRVTARRFLKSYPFQEAFLRDEARMFLNELEMPVILLGGINQLDTVTDALEEGFAFVAMARALLCEPDLPNRWRMQAAPDDAACIHCNKCMPTIYRGTHCVITAPD